MKKYIISEEGILAVLGLMKQRQFMAAKKILNTLPKLNVKENKKMADPTEVEKKKEKFKEAVKKIKEGLEQLEELLKE